MKNLKQVTVDDLNAAYSAVEAVYDGLDDDEVTPDERDTLRDVLDLLETWTDA